VIEQLLEASRRVQERSRTAQQQGATAQIPQGGAESKIMVDPRTNSLLIMALPEDMQNIKELVAQLDVEVIEPERNYHVFSLENVAAEEVAEVLESFIDDSSRLSQTSGQARPAGGQGQAPVSNNDNQVVVVPDPATNSLLIAASKSRYEEVLDLIRKLDQRQDQVLIETALIELSGGKTLDIGVEVGYAEDPGSSGQTGFGVTSFGLSSIDLSDPGNPIRIPGAATGVTAGIISSDDFQLPLLIAAAQGRDDTNVLNIPSVLVNNNGTATVSSKNEEPTVELQQQQVGAPIQSFGGYQEAGITMTISPSISASGYLRLNVFLEISTFGISSNANLPPSRLTRTIDTAVSVPDGDTMVIGGIITDNRTESRSQVPLLGDLPLLGALFRRDQNNSDHITLYFFVTPHILRDKDFADLSEISYQKKLEAADMIGVDRIRKIDPDFDPGKPEVNLKGFEIPLYRSAASGEVDPEAVGLDPVKRAEMLEQKSGEGDSNPR
jgi:general secretion pathway protein D